MRFRDCFPKKGGGEDFAFFMELYYQTGKTLKSVKKADVFHNWWHGGRRNYSQFIRWSYADFELFRLIPDIAYRSFPNVAEALMAGLIIGLTYWIFTGSPAILIAATLGVLLGELIVVFYFLLKGKNLRKSFYAPEVMLVRAAADWGRLKGIIANRKFSDLLKRPNFTGAKAPRNFHFWPIRKFTAYIVFTIFLLWLIRTIWP